MNAYQGRTRVFASREAKSLHIALLDNRTGVVGNIPFISGNPRDPGRRAGNRCEGGFAMPVIKTCPQCSRDFRVKPSRADTMFCSRSCFIASPHYSIAQSHAYSPETFSIHFWASVDKGPGCWLWTGSRAPTGYGQVARNGQAVHAHRVAFELTYGPIPLGLFVCHHCDNRPCVRPDHLFLGTHQDNMTDKRMKGRCARLTGDRNGLHRHPEKAARGLRSGHYTHPEATLREEQNPRALLKRDDVLSILTKHRSGVSQQQLAREFQVCRRQIGRIVRGLQWRATVTQALAAIGATGETK